MVSLVFTLPVFVPPCFVQTSDLGWGYGRVKEGREGEGGDGIKWPLKLLVIDRHLLHRQNHVYGISWCD